MYEILSMILFSLIRFIKQYPEPLSVIVRPSASLVLAISISFGRPNKKKKNALQHSSNIFDDYFYEILNYE